MNEHSYIDAIHRKLPHDLFVWKINANFANGTPDCFYEGETDDLWVEYKWLASIPKRDKTLINLCDTKKFLSALQQKWLNRRAKHRRNVWVILGTPEGGAIFRRGEWNALLSVRELRGKLLPHEKIREAILDVTDCKIVVAQV